MKRGFRCKKEVIEDLISGYDEIISSKFNGEFLTPIYNFEEIAESSLRVKLSRYYNNSRSRDQAWRSCKGALYEYAVFRALKHIIQLNKDLGNRYSIIAANEIGHEIGDNIAIKNWCDIYPDTDILVYDKINRNVKIIISCKTSLRERLTETAFWKRELEKHQRTKDVLLFFITTDKDNELKNNTNRYIILHVLDCTFITDPNQLENLIKSYGQKYGDRGDFNKLISKIKDISEFEEYLRRI